MKIPLLSVSILILMILFTSCATSRVKKDCQGIKHTRQKGGFYLYKSTKNGCIVTLRKQKFNWKNGDNKVLYLCNCATVKLHITKL